MGNDRRRREAISVPSLDRTRDRRFAPGGKKYQIKEIWASQHEILRLAILGWKGSEIAAKLNCTEATVSNCVNSEIGRRQLQIMQGARDGETLDIMKEIRDLAPKALKVIEQTMDDPIAGPKTRLSAAVDLLDRGGFAAPKVIQGQFVTAHLTVEDITELKNRARQIIATSEEVAEAEVIGG